jgi:ABC-2 type transport system ATP-binding protein
VGRCHLAAIAALNMHGMRAVDEAALSIEGVSHRYGTRQALVDVTFAVAPATFTVLLGLNGAGKSTLFSLITRLYAVQQGRIRIFGQDVTRASGEALRMVGIVFQPRTLDLDLSVAQNLIYHAALHGLGSRESAERANALLQRIALLDRVNDKVRSLSGGQMRQVEITRALLHRPRLLLLDEPTVGLDIKSRANILEHVRGLVKDGVSVLWATHLIDEVAENDAVVVLHEGCVLAQGAAAHVRESASAHDMRAAFLALTQASVSADEPA